MPPPTRDIHGQFINTSAKPVSQVGQLQKQIEDAVSKDARRRPNLKDKDKMAQAVALYHRHIFGDRTVPELVEEFGIAETTVKRRLSLAREVGIPDQVREIFIHEMLPMAMAVVRNSLLSDDEAISLKAAQFVIKELEAMKPKQITVSASAVTNQPIESLEEWRSKLPALPEITITEVTEDYDEPEEPELRGGSTEIQLVSGEDSGGGAGQGQGNLQELP